VPDDKDDRPGVNSRHSKQDQREDETESFHIQA
jgi:hypothetical protein